MLRALIIISAVFWFAGDASAQAGKNLEFWSSVWTQDSELHKAVVRISCRLDSITTATGSGCLVEGRDVITAAHVVDGACEIYVLFHDGSKIKAKMKSFNTERDLAILELAEDAPAGCIHSKISDADVEVGESVEVCGFSGGDGLRHFSAKVLGTDGDRVVMSGYVAQGDSGGPIFNHRGEVVSVVSGGCLWLKNQTVNGVAGAAKVTTPILGPAAKRISR
jgi:S1-C subfamily serine protease